MDSKDLGKILPNEYLTKINENIKQMKRPKFNYGTNTEAVDAIYKANFEKCQRELEDNENLKRIAVATEDINAKFDYVAKDMDYILSSLGSKFQRVEQLGEEEKETLDRILLALQYKDQGNGKSKIRDAIENKSIDVILNAIIAYIQLKITGVQ